MQDLKIVSDNTTPGISTVEEKPAPLEELQLSVRAYNALRRAEIQTVEEVASLSDEQLLAIPNLGTRALAEIKERLNVYQGELPVFGVVQPVEMSATDSQPQDARQDISLRVLDLTIRVHRALERGGIFSLAQLTNMSPEQIRDVRNIGEKGAAEIAEKLAICLESYSKGLNAGTAERTERRKETPISPKRGISLDVLKLTGRPYGALRRVGVDTVPQLACMSPEQILDIRNVGEKGAAEIAEKLADYLNHHPESLTAAMQEVIEEEEKFPCFTLVASDLLEQAAAAPLSQISISRLALPKCTTNALLHGGIDSIAALANMPAGSFSSSSQVVRRLIQYLEWLAVQDENTWKYEMVGKGASPMYRLCLAETTLDELVNRWLKILDERELDVLRARFAGHRAALTLDEVGIQLGVSRERVRQIETKALRKLKHPDRRAAVSSIIALLDQQFANAGGLMSEDEACEYVASLVTAEQIDARWVARLILHTHSGLEQVKRCGLWVHESEPHDLVDALRSQLIEMIKDEGGLVSLNRLIDRLAGIPFFVKHRRRLTDGFIAACLRTHPKITIVEGQYALKREKCSSTKPKVPIKHSSPKQAPAPESQPVQTPSLAPKLEIDLRSGSAPEKPPETLEEWEYYLRTQIGQVELLGEIPISDAQRLQLGKAIGLRMRTLGHGETVKTLRSRYPCALAVYLVAQGMYGYHGGDYWSDVVETASLHRNRVQDIGRLFEEILEALGLPLFYDMRTEASRFVSLILAHGGIPNYCLPDFFANMLQPSVLQAHYADMSAAELIDEWSKSTARLVTDKPVIRFLVYGGQVAENLVERCREMVWQYLDSGTVPEPEAVGLSRRVVVAYREWIVEQGVDQVQRDTGDRWRLRRPQILVDPWGEGVLVDLPPQQVPATTIYADVAWQVSTANEARAVPVRIHRSGFDRKTEAASSPLRQPAAQYTVSLQIDGQVQRTWQYPGVDSERPLLVFDPQRGTLLPWSYSLPARPLGLLYPAHLTLQISGDAHLLEDLPRLPWGWAGFCSETWDLTRATRLVLLKDGQEALVLPLRPDEAAQRPQLVGGNLSPTIPDGRAPVYIGSPPLLRIPLDGRQNPTEALTRWRVTIRNKWTAVPEIDVTATLTELKAAVTINERSIDLHLNHSTLLGNQPYGNFFLRLRGPIGRDAEFTLRSVPHLVIRGYDGLHLPDPQRGPLPVTCQIETAPDSELEYQGEEKACSIQLLTQQEACWVYEVQVDSDVTDVELSIVHRLPDSDAIYVPISIPIRRLRWALVGEQAGLEQGEWTGQVIRRPVEGLLQLQSPILLVRLPLSDDCDVGMRLRLLTADDAELQVADLIPPQRDGHPWRCDLAAFLDTIRANRSSVLRFELRVWGLPGRIDAFCLPVLRLTETLDIADVQLARHRVKDGIALELMWCESAPLRNRYVRFWPLWRPWDPFLEQSIPDEAIGQCTFTLPVDSIPSGAIRIEFLVIDPWASPVLPTRPPQGAPATADIEWIAASERLIQLEAELQRDGNRFESFLERAAIHFQLGDLPRAKDDWELCYQHLDEGTIPQILFLVNLAQDGGDRDMFRALQMRMFSASCLERLLHTNPGEISPDDFRVYMTHLPRSGLLSASSCQMLLSVRDETVRLRAVQQLIHCSNPLGPEAVLTWVRDGDISDQDAIALLRLNLDLSANYLQVHLEQPAALRLLEALALELGDRSPLVCPGTWVQCEAGWGRVEKIEDLDGRSVQQFIVGQTDYRLHVILRPSIDGEPIVIDLQRKLIIFTEAHIIYTCTKCGQFSSSDYRLIVARHDRVAHGGVGPGFREEKVTMRSLRICRFISRPPGNAGLGL